jgi:hypothetical protein
MSVVNLAGLRAERRAAAIATAVLTDLAVIQDRLIGYFHVDAGNPATDAELGAAGLLCVLAERLELAARTLQGSPRLSSRTKENP